MNQGRRTRRRGLATLGLVLLAVLLVPSPADAHTRVREYADDVDSRITAAPDLPGVEWTLHAGGVLAEVENHSDRDLVVLGYDGEPYLRVGPEGTFENRRSPATYLNQERYGDVAIPPVADPSAAPEWVRVDHRSRAVWHDHRTHWMSPEPPGQGATRGAQRLHRWELPFRHDGREHAVAGELRWLPTPSPWPFLVAGLALTAPAAAGLWRVRSAAWMRTDRRLLRPAAATLGVVALANAVHLPDEVLAQPQPFLDVAFGLLHTTLFVTVGLVGAAMAWSGRGPARPALGIGAGAVLFHQGLLHLPSLGAALLPTSLPDTAFRLLVAVSVAQAVPVAVVLTVTWYRGLQRTKVPDRPDPSTPGARDERHVPARQETPTVSIYGCNCPSTIATRSHP